MKNGTPGRTIGEVAMPNPRLVKREEQFPNARQGYFIEGTSWTSDACGSTTARMLSSNNLKASRSRLCHSGIHMMKLDGSLLRSRSDGTRRLWSEMIDDAEVVPQIL